MSNHISKKECKESRVPICLIEERIVEKQREYFEKFRSHLTVPRAIIQLILDK